MRSRSIASDAEPSSRAGFALPSLLAIAFLLSGCDGAGSEFVAFPLRSALSDCHLSSPLVDTRVAARCGMLELPLDHSAVAAPGAPSIGLRFALLPAVSRNPEPDALVYLSGGPGQSALESFPQVARAFREINHDRDILLVDQRGTGGSGRLDCPEEEPERSASALAGLDPASDALEALAAWSRECVRELGAETDLLRYGTADAVEDLEALRASLGYPSLDLYGISYGTRLAQAYAGAYPERSRLLVLDGVVADEPRLARRSPTTRKRRWTGSSSAARGTRTAARPLGTRGKTSRRCAPRSIAARSR